MQLAVFASGNGSNFQAIVNAVENGTLNASIVLCLSNRGDVGVLDRAAHYSIPTAVVRPSDFPDDEEYCSHLLAQLDHFGTDFIALAGYMKMIPAAVVRQYSGRMLNIHPALLPNYGGKGMYGIHVHRAVLRDGQSESGATVHVVDEEYDTGPIVLQKRVPVLPGDTAEDLAARVLRIEHQVYPEALALFADNKVSIEGRNVIIR